MKYILFFSIILSAFSYAGSGYDVVFENENLNIRLNVACSPCDLACEKIAVILTDKTHSTSIKMPGNTINIGDYDNFRGYEFRHKDYIYSLTKSSDSNDNLWRYRVHKKRPNGKYTLIVEQKIKLTVNNGAC
ncbi:hypothetical protein ACGVWS_08375 [Enterobacteriaceae bacterium LUAb1]